MTERSDIHKSSIDNLQFPDKSGFTLRYNRLVGVGIIRKTFYCVKDISYIKHYKISYYLNMK